MLYHHHYLLYVMFMYVDTLAFIIFIMIAYGVYTFIIIIMLSITIGMIP